MAIELPKGKVPAKTQDPNYLILFGLPKVGKTTTLSTLENNLIFDLEKGSTYVEALKVELNSLQDIYDACQAIAAAGCPYKYITIDTITALEEMVKPYALDLWHKSPQYSADNVLLAQITDVTRVPRGGGYSFIREAIEMVIDWISKITENVIICGHVKDVSLDESQEQSIKDLDLVGKTKRILSAKSDAIGFVHRAENGDLYINFGNNGEILTGARPKHLAGKDILVASRNEDGTFESHWENIYPSLKK